MGRAAVVVADDGDLVRNLYARPGERDQQAHGFDGVATACVFAGEERARESSAFMLDSRRKELTG